MKARSSAAIFLAVTLLLSLAACNSPAAPPTATPGPTAQPGETEHKLTVNGLARSYLLHVPAGIDPLQPVPVVFAFHGLWGNPADEENRSGFDPVADTNHFLVVYPAGSGDDRSWNAGSCCGIHNSAAENNVDETAFVRQMLADLGTSFSIDPKRVYSMGFSNGAALSYRLACEMSDTIAAIAANSAPMMFDACQPQQPVAVMHVHGLADFIAPFDGGQSSLDSTWVFPPVKDTIATWVQLDGCTGAPQEATLKNVITQTVYAGCRGGTAVELDAVQYLEHDVPPANVLPPERVWDFFAAHPKP